MMKKNSVYCYVSTILIVIFTLNFYSQSFGQMVIDDHCRVNLISQTTDWTSAFRCCVPTYNSCAYNVWYGNEDKFFVHASGYLWAKRGGFFGSDISLKENITPIDDAIGKILKLNGVQYDFKAISKEDLEERKAPRYGFIAQEVKDVLPGIVKQMPDSTLAISYTDVIAVLVEAVKSQQKQIDLLVKELDNTKIILSNINNEVNQQENSKENFLLSNDEAVLYQNAPNPFNEQTTIRCYIPENVKNAEICVYSTSGVKVKCFNISQRSNVDVVLEAGHLSGGIYTYILMIDGKAFDSKQMILTK